MRFFTVGGPVAPTAGEAADMDVELLGVELLVAVAIGLALDGYACEVWQVAGDLGDGVSSEPRLWSALELVPLAPVLCRKKPPAVAVRFFGESAGERCGCGGCTCGCSLLVCTFIGNDRTLSCCCCCWTRAEAPSSAAADGCGAALEDTCAAMAADELSDDDDDCSWLASGGRTFAPAGGCCSATGATG